MTASCRRPVRAWCGVSTAEPQAGVRSDELVMRAPRTRAVAVLDQLLLAPVGGAVGRSQQTPQRVWLNAHVVSDLEYGPPAWSMRPPRTVLIEAMLGVASACSPCVAKVGPLEVIR